MHDVDALCARLGPAYAVAVYNRLQSDGAVIIINQRMHEDDLSGRLIEQMKAGKDKWEIVELPAIAIDHDRDGHRIIDPIGRKAGEALWPAEYDIPRLERRRDNSLARYFSAMFQQQPVPDESELFAPDKITRSGTIRATSSTVFEVGTWPGPSRATGPVACRSARPRLASSWSST
jgi:hypothetical protein